VVVICALILIKFLNSETGLAMRATGANPRMARAQGVKTAWMILSGMAVSNALVALAGSLFAQSQGSADVTMGVGVIVVGLASVIGGEAIITPSTVIKAVVACIVGAILYRLAIAFALNLDMLGLKAQDLNLVTSVLVMIAIVLPRYRLRKPAS
jgi:putative tryptophan/tyrosine transport system permease protein